MTPPQPPPEAMLIKEKRESAVPRLSQREAAQIAGMSPTRWRQLEDGVSRTKGMDLPERAPDDTLARMAMAVGVTPDDLRGADRAPAAHRLEQLLASAPDDRDYRAQAAGMAATVPGLTDRQRDALTGAIAADLKRILQER